MAELDAVLIPGGGVSAFGEVVPWVKARLDRAIALSPSTTFFIPLSAGTTHKPPPLNQKGFPILESVAAAEYLVAQGVPDSCILPETISLDTIGNAYFARVQHTDPLGLQRLHVITSEFHLPRVEAIFNWIFGISDARNPYQLTFEAVPNIGISLDVLETRRQREAASLQQVEDLRSHLTTLAEIHRWLYTEHEAYAVSKSPRRLKDAALKTY
ncbi:YdcF family protein [Oscillatoria sp. CS-180]|uniref:YdcF family protein n=1 Tax=Oscillatoria sp. CS-180 TaxID=3021720 RepID=UPI00232EC425|nr:YdcF family protein [Oscillatoria sp. CS-180]MDB9528841.1 YdcF family protein [Oscillatoria sp. CS-180]